MQIPVALQIDSTVTVNSLQIGIDGVDAQLLYQYKCDSFKNLTIRVYLKMSTSMEDGEIERCIHGRVCVDASSLMRLSWMHPWTHL